MRRALAALLLFVTATLAQAPAGAATIEGIAKNLKTGEPLADVRVTVTPEPATATTKSATTDSEGKFIITGVQPGRHSITATRTLFFRPRRNTGAVVVSVAADQRLRDVQILLMPTAVIAGRVVDENREPLRSIRIEALRAEYRNGVRTWVAAGQNTTDDRGEYRVFNLQPGTYYVRATQSAINSGPAMYYPGVPDSQDASAIQIEAGAELAAIDVMMRRSPEYAVTLKLGGVPAGSTATLSIQRRNSKITETVLSRVENLPDNTYRFARLTPGAYEILAIIAIPAAAPQPRIVTHSGTIPVNIGRADEDLGTVAVRATVPVTGRILAPEPLPTPLDMQRLQLSLVALNTTQALNATVRGSSTPPGFNIDGSFTLPNVGVGRFQIQLAGLPADTYLISARSGSREVLDSGYTVSGDHAPLEILIGGPGSVGVVEGTVVNARGEAVPGSTVVLVPAAERRTNPSAFRSATADQQGTFHIRSVLAGEYKVMAWEDVEPGAFMDPDFLKDFETRGEALRVQRGSQTAVSVRVIPAS